MEKITKSSKSILIDPNEPLILPDGTALVGRIEWFLYALCCLDYQNLPTPMSRIEEFANSLITGEIPNIEPQSRAEQFFLAILDGNVSNLPQPQSRSEVLLDKLARGEFDLSDVEPIQSHYELLLAYLIKNGGIGNIDYVLYEFSEAMKTMYNTVEKPFKSLELSGNTLVNCVLENTENDDYTSFDEDYSGTSFTINGTSEGAIKSAILKGQTLVNLIDYSNPLNGYIAKDNDTLTIISQSENTWFNGTYKLIGVAHEKKYRVMWDSLTYTHTDSHGAEQIIGVYSFDSDGKQILLNCIRDSTNYFDFTIPSNTRLEKTVVRIHATTFTGEQGATTTVKGLKVIEYQQGMENWDIPYFESMQSVKLPVLTTTGKNLFDKTSVVRDYYITSVGTEFKQVGDERNATDFISVMPDTTYTLSGIKNSGITNSNTQFYIAQYDSNKNVIKSQIFNIGDDKATLTVNSNASYIRTTVRTQDLERFQIEYGTQATVYEPYKSNILTVNEDVALRGIGDVKDELDCLTGKLTEHIGEIVLDGSEEWAEYNIHTQEGYTAFTITIPTLNNLYHSTDITFISADFPTGTWNDYRNNLMTEFVWNHDPNRIGIRVKNETATDVNGIKTFLSNNNIRINYKLATPVIKTVDLNVVDQNNTKIDKIHVFDETTHVNASSDELTPTVNIGKSVSYPTIIKPNTKYTVDLKRNDKPLTVNLGGTEVTFASGETRKVITTPNTLTNDKLSYYGVGAKCNEIMLIEGEVERNVDYFTGMQSVVMQNQMPILKTVGKNLLNDNTSVSGWIMEDGRTTIRGALGSGSDYLSDFIYVGNINQIKISRGCYVTTFDENKKNISQFINVVDANVSNCSYIRIAVSCNAQVALGLVGTIQVEEGSVATTYEPYKSSILSCNDDVTLRGIGDVQDTLDCLTGKVVQNIYEFILDGSQNIDNDGNLLYYYLPLGVHNNRSNSDKLPSITVGQILDGLEGIAPQNRGNSSRVYINVNGITTREEMKNFFLNNPTTIQCILDEKLLKAVDLNVVDQDENAIPKIKSYKDVTHLEVTVPKQSLLPHISAEVATDNSKDMSSLTTKHQEISEAQSAIQDNIQSQSDEIDTALMATTEIFESILE